MKLFILLAVCAFTSFAHADNLECEMDAGEVQTCLMDVGPVAHAPKGYPTSATKAATGRKVSRLVTKKDLAGELRGATGVDGKPNLTGIRDSLAAQNTLRNLEVFLKSGPASTSDLSNVKPLPSKPTPKF